jgi:hypothetical protein
MVTRWGSSSIIRIVCSRKNSFVNGKGKRYGGSGLWQRAYIDLAVMLFDDVPDDGQSQTGPFIQVF